MALLVKHTILTFENYSKDEDDSKKSVLWGFVLHTDTKSDQTQEDPFSEAVKNSLMKFMKDYVEVILEMCEDVQKYSSRTCLFPKEVEGALDYIQTLKEPVFSSTIAEVLQQYYHRDAMEMRGRAEMFIKDYLENFPYFSGSSKKAEIADEYSEQILLYAKKKAEILIR